MKKESVRAPGQIKNLMEQQNQYTKECGALYKINTITLIEMDTFEPYFK